MIKTEKINTYQKALKFIHGRTKFKKIPTLSRMKLFLKLLGNPQNKISSIHVTGTNGKGSVVAFLTNLLSKDYKKVGSFTSPFLMYFNERIRINHQPISNFELIKLVNIIRPIVAKLDEELPTGGPTEFEIDTALMWVYFARQKVDVAVIEVGLGGLLDSTNIINPSVSIITTVGYDHMHLLGNTLSKIAYQKSGIIKDQIPVIVGRLPKEAFKVIQHKVLQTKSKFYYLGSQIKVSYFKSLGWKENFSFRFKDFNFSHLTISLLGKYQIANAALALTAYLIFLKQRNKGADFKSIYQNLKCTKWPGRFELMQKRPYIVLDGAHNEPAVLSLTKLIKSHFKNLKIFLLYSALSDKKYQKMLRIFQTIPNCQIFLTYFKGPGKRQAFDPNKLAALVNDPRVLPFLDWQKAIKKIENKMRLQDILVITGSLFFISDVRHFILKI